MPIKMSERDALRLTVLSYRMQVRGAKLAELQALQLNDQTELRALMERYGIDPNVGGLGVALDQTDAHEVGTVFDPTTGSPMEPKVSAEVSKPR